MKSSEYQASLRQIGVVDGDVLLIHSSVSRLMRAFATTSPGIELGDLLNLFLGLVGDRGTLLFPLFNFGFCRGEEFSYQTTPSGMGALTEVARNDSRFVRTQHPIYSFAVSGPNSNDFARLKNVSALADDGPFGLLRRLNGKILVIDLEDQNSMTMYHHVEEVVGVDYRYHKSFTAPYRDADDKVELRTYELFVWDEQQGVRTDVNRAGELLWQKGLYRGQRPLNGFGTRVIGCHDFFSVVREIIEQGRAKDYLYSIDDSANLEVPK